MLLDHRANLIVERTRLQSRLRWLLHELDPAIQPAGRSLDVKIVLERLKRDLAKQPPSALLRICRELIARIGELSVQVRALERELRPLVRRHARRFSRCPASESSTPRGCSPRSPTSAASPPKPSSRSTPASHR